MAELTASIKVSAGPWTPLLVRPLPQSEKTSLEITTGQYQILAGHRRYHACKHAGITTVPCVVRTCTDAEALALLIADNPHHADIDPFEEARVLRLLLDDPKQSHDQIAAYYGRPLSWVHRRARLARLSEKVLERIEEYYPHWSAAHMELIARYEHDEQEAILDRRNYNYGDLTVADLDRELRARHHDVVKAPWNIDDADLVPTAGACSTCSKRSSCHGHLFPDLAPKTKSSGKAAVAVDTCLDQTCWAQKTAAQLTLREAGLAVKHPGLVRVSTEYRHADKNVIPKQSYERCTKTTEGARPAIVVDGPSVGKLTWIAPPVSQPGKRKPAVTAAGRTTTATGEPTLDSLRAELADKREGLARRRQVMVFRCINAALLAMEPIDTRELSAYQIQNESQTGNEDASDEQDNDLTHEGDEDPTENLATHGPVSADDDTSDAPLWENLDLSTSLPTLAGLIAWVYIHGSWNGCGGFRWGNSRIDTHRLFEDLVGDSTPDQLRAMLWNATWNVLCDTMRHTIANRDHLSSVPRTVAHLIGIDVAPIAAHVERSMTEPKAWAKQYARILEECA